MLGPAAPAFSAMSVVNNNNDITRTLGVVAPGEIISIYGSNLGVSCTYPQCPPYSFSGASILTKDLANTRVLFDGVPAPVLYASSGQLNAIAPYGLDGKTSTIMTVEYEGVASAPLSIPVSPTVPGVIATLNAANYLPPDAGNAVPGGGYLTLYTTGEGQTNPPGVDGLAIGYSTGITPRADIAAMIGGIPVPAPAIFRTETEISGLLQINIPVPDGLPTGVPIPLVLTIGGVPAAPVNIYVK